MTRNQAQRMMDDIGQELSERDYCENIYLSIRDVGTKIFKKCAYHDVDGFTFIWTKTERFLISRKEIGDYVVIPYDSQIAITIKKVL